ncbi:MAG TPA: co-chaperone GroES [Actinomycetota bacterium]
MAPRTTKLRTVKAEGEPEAEREAEPVEKIRLTADRLLVRVPDESERRSKGGLVIPATAVAPIKRCVWSEVVLVGPETRNLKPGDRVLFIPQTGLEVDVRGEVFLLLRERDVQAIASDRTDPQAGQYL